MVWPPEAFDRGPGQSIAVPAVPIGDCQAVGIEVGELLESYTGDSREMLRPVAEAAVDLVGMSVEEADALTTSRGFYLVRISPTADGPYPMQWTFNLDIKRIVAIVDAETVTEVHVG